MTAVEANLWTVYAADRSIQNRNRIVEHHYRLIEPVAKKMRRRLRDIELDELMSAASVGLIKAVERFDPARRVTFATFAGCRMNGEMLDYARSMDRVSRTARERYRKWDETTDVLTDEHGVPTEEQVERHLGIEPGGWSEFIRSARSMSTQIDHDDVDSFLVDRRDPAREVDDREEFEFLISSLPQREQKMLRLRFVDGLLLGPIGKLVGTGEINTGTLVNKATRSLRNKVQERMKLAA